MYNLKKVNAMKKSYLLPVGFKKAGLWMVVPFLVLSALCLCAMTVMPMVAVLFLIMLFLSMVVTVVGQVMAAAVVMREENDLTV